MGAFNHAFRFSQSGLRGIPKCRTSVVSLCFLHSSAHEFEPKHNVEHEVAIALGSNMGNRLDNFNEALRLMKASGIHISRHACLYESAPAYVTNQPPFLNSAVRGVTRLELYDLLRVLKGIEKELGRTDGIRYGPRPIDLDILFYDKIKVKSETLTVPHERIWERPFVVAPLVDLLGSSEHNDTIATWHSFTEGAHGIFGKWKMLGGESLVSGEGLRRVLPIRDQLWDWSQRTYVMGVLNLTPDSFSDGGKFLTVDNAISQVRMLISEGADIIDIGAQSTRPMATRISANEELNRLVPVLEAVLTLPELDGKLLSVDTFYSEVALVAVNKGVHIINDVSGGLLDPDILKIVSDHKVGYVIMHMRGDPSTMQNKENLQYKDVCKEVAHELHARVSKAELSGIPAWRIILDPGIGFSKKCNHNLELLMGLPELRRELEGKSIAISNAPILVGPSRKRFLGDICNRTDPIHRDAATMAAVTAGILGGANIIRVHNVHYGTDAAKVSDALLRHRRICE